MFLISLENNGSVMELGERIRVKRRESGLTIRQVCEKAEITPSLLSQIENSKVNPSINTLMAVAEALEIPIGSFFEEPVPEVSPVVRKADRRKIETQSGVTFSLLMPQITGHSFEFMYNEYEPGGSTGKLYQHTGEECGLVLQGALEVTYNGDTYVLQEGDSILIDSRKPHKIRNIADGKTIAVWIDSPPSW